MNVPAGRILIIDDSPEDRMTYCRFMAADQANEYQITEAATAEEGLTCLQQNLFNCILLDYRLPDRNGLDILSDLPEKNDLRSTAIVMLTGNGDEAVAVEAMKRGVQDYLPKNRITAEALRRAVRTAVEKAALLQRIEQQRQELLRLIITDGLTGLYNRRHFDERVQGEIQRARRYNIPVSLIMVDIDHFKAINDNFGHLVGDAVLKAVGDVLRGMRSTDIAARYGGDEFAVLLTNTDLHGARTVADQILDTISSRIASQMAKTSPIVTCSIGVAQWSEEIENAENWIALADRAMYSSKHSGRNQACSA